jgi:hypothetical protein
MFSLLFISLVIYLDLLCWTVLTAPWLFLGASVCVWLEIIRTMGKPLAKAWRRREGEGGGERGGGVSQKGVRVVGSEGMAEILLWAFSTPPPPPYTLVINPGSFKVSWFIT